MIRCAFASVERVPDPGLGCVIFCKGALNVSDHCPANRRGYIGIVANGNYYNGVIQGLGSRVLGATSLGDFASQSGEWTGKLTILLGLRLQIPGAL